MVRGIVGTSSQPNKKKGFACHPNPALFKGYLEDLPLIILCFSFDFKLKSLRCDIKLSKIQQTTNPLIVQPLSEKS